MTATIHTTPTARTERRRLRRRRDSAPASAPDALFGPPAAHAAAATVESSAPEPVLAPSGPRAPLPPTALTGLGTPSLDDVLSYAWESLRAQVAASCMVCGGEVEPLGEVPGGRCSGCGSVVE